MNDNNIMDGMMPDPSPNPTLDPSAGPAMDPYDFASEETSGSLFCNPWMTDLGPSDFVADESAAGPLCNPWMTDLGPSDFVADEPFIDASPLPSAPAIPAVPGQQPSGYMYSNPFMDPDLADELIDLYAPDFDFGGGGSDTVTFGGDEPEKSLERMKLDESEALESQRDIAVEHYQDAKNSGDIEEMLKWEAEANKRQGDLYNLWDTTTYGLDPKAPGID